MTIKVANRFGVRLPPYEGNPKCGVNPEWVQIFSNICRCQDYTSR